LLVKKESRGWKGGEKGGKGRGKVRGGGGERYEKVREERREWGGVIGEGI